MTVVDGDTVIADLRIIKYSIEISGYSVGGLVPGCNGDGAVTIEKRVAAVDLICAYAIIYSRARIVIIRLIDMCGIRYIYLEP